MRVDWGLRPSASTPLIFQAGRKLRVPFAEIGIDVVRTIYYGSRRMSRAGPRG